VTVLTELFKFWQEVFRAKRTSMKVLVLPVSTNARPSLPPMQTVTVIVSVLLMPETALEEMCISWLSSGFLDCESSLAISSGSCLMAGLGLSLVRAWIASAYWHLWPGCQGALHLQQMPDFLAGGGTYTAFSLVGPVNIFCGTPWWYRCCAKVWGWRAIDASPFS
jgi:hypothetical protein